MFFCHSTVKQIDELFESSDNTLFSAILNNPGHVLRFFFPFPM